MGGLCFHIEHGGNAMNEDSNLGAARSSCLQSDLSKNTKNNPEKRRTTERGISLGCEGWGGAEGLPSVREILPSVQETA